MSYNLDGVDMGILQSLQSDARNATTESIGERVGLSASAVASRIKNLEEEGVIEGYAPLVDYEKAGFDRHLLIVGTITSEDREATLEDAIGVENVVSVTELLTDDENVTVEVVCPSQERAETACDELNELGIQIVNTEIVKRRYERVFNHFGTEFPVEA